MTAPIFDKILGKLRDSDTEAADVLAGLQAMDASQEASARTALGIGSHLFSQHVGIYDSASMTATQSSFQIGTITAGSGLTRPLLFCPTGTIYNTFQVYASREQSLYLYCIANKWYIGAAVGDTTNSYYCSTTGYAGVVQGSYVGQGTFSGTTITIAAATLGTLGAAAVGENRTASATSTGSRPASTFMFTAPIIAANVVLELTSNYYTVATHNLTTVLVCNETGLTPVVSRVNKTNGTPYTVTVAIPEAFRGKQCAFGTCIYDADMASPCGGANTYFNRVSIGLEPA